jgi:branched-chain amino acid transport system permease protein
VTLRTPTLAAPTRWGRLATGWPVVALVGLVMLPWLVDGYTLYTTARVMAIGLLAVSVAVLTGTAGLPTLGQVAPYAVGAYTAGLLAKHQLSTLGPVLLAAAALAGAVFALVVGLAVVRTRAVVCLMVTLAVAVLTATAADQWRGLTGGGDGLIGIPTPYAFPAGPRLVDDRHLYWYALAVTAAAVGTTAWLLRSRAGMLLRGVRDNETRMRASGHPVAGYLLIAHTAAGGLAGLGGGLLVNVQRFVSPSDVGFQTGALVLLAVVVGGAHSIWGALAAAALVVTVRDWAAAGVPGHGPLLLGVLFIAAVFALPRGVAGALPTLATTLRSGGRRLMWRVRGVR